MGFIRRILRRRLFWALVALFVVYSGFGFLIAPRIIQRQVVAKIQSELGRVATLQDVDVNPWTFAVRLEGFRLQDPDHEAFVEFAELFVDFQTSSLFRRAFTFKTVRLVSPRTHVRLMPDEKPNFQDIIHRAAARAAEPRRDAGRRDARPQKPPPILLQRIEIHDARLRASNLASANPEAIAFTPVNLVLDNFSTIPNHDGTYTLQATGQGGGHWEWTGALTFEPLRSSGTFAITGEHLPAIWEVIRKRVAWEIPSGDLSLRLHYAIDVRGDSIQAAIHDATIGLDRFVCREQGRAADLLAIDSLRQGRVMGPR